MKPTAKVFSSLLLVALGAARMAAQDPHAAFNNIYFVAPGSWVRF